MDVKLETMGGGLVAKRFEKALAEVAENISNLNTDYKIKRKITLTLTLTPDEERSQVGVDIQTAVKIAPEKSVPIIMAIGNDGQGNLITAEWQTPSLPMGTQIDKQTGELVSITGGMHEANG